jgi:hypothetical protein
MVLIIYKTLALPFATNSIFIINFRHSSNFQIMHTFNKQFRVEKRQKKSQIAVTKEDENNHHDP